MRNRRAELICVIGLSLITSACYNNPDVSARPPGSGSHVTHAKPQVGPGTTAGGSTAGPQPVVAKGHSKAPEQPKPANPEHKH